MPRHRVSAEKRVFARQLRRRQTSAEDLLWRELRDRRLGGWKFRRQVPIEGYIADFTCFDARLIVEVDGPLHAQPEQREKDVIRDATLRRHGFRTLRFDSEIGAGTMAQEISQALARPPHPAPDRRQGPPSPARGEGLALRARRGHVSAL
jgi:very-short-patch-repair endonuclease